MRVDAWHMKHGAGHVAHGTWRVALHTLLCPDGCTHSLLKVCRCGASRISVPSGRCASYILAFPGSCPSTWETVRKKGVDGRRREEEHKDVEEEIERVFFCLGELIFCLGEQAREREGCGGPLEHMHSIRQVKKPDRS